MALGGGSSGEPGASNSPGTPLWAEAGASFKPALWAQPSVTCDPHEANGFLVQPLRPQEKVECGPNYGTCARVEV